MIAYGIGLVIGNIGVFPQPSKTMLELVNHKEVILTEELLNNVYTGDELMAVEDVKLNKKLVKDLNKDGYARVRIDGKIQRTDEDFKLDRYVKHDIEIVIDRFSINDLSRLTEATEQALAKGEGLMMVLDEK